MALAPALVATSLSRPLLARIPAGADEQAFTAASKFLGPMAYILSAWTAVLTFKPQPQGIFEHACREGNHGLSNIFSAGRQHHPRNHFTALRA